MPDARVLLNDGLALEKAGAFERALESYESALAAAEDPPIEAEALRRQSHALRAMGQWERAVEAAHRSARVAERARLQRDHAEALNAEAAVHQSRGEFDQAVPLYERMLTLTTDDRILGVALQNLASIAAQRDQLDLAEGHFMEAHSHFERAGYVWGQAYVLTNTTALALDRGHYDTAADRGRDAVAAANRLGDLELVAVARINFGEALYRQGRLEEAETELMSAVGQFSSSGNLWRRIEGLRLLGLIAERTDDPELARRFYERALADAEALGAQTDVASLRERLEALGGG